MVALKARAFVQKSRVDDAARLRAHIVAQSRAGGPRSSGPATRIFCRRSTGRTARHAHARPRFLCHRPMPARPPEGGAHVDAVAEDRAGPFPTKSLAEMRTIVDMVICEAQLSKSASAFPTRARI